MISFLNFILVLASLNLIELRVPGNIGLGTHAHLSCSWRLAPHDVLYSVKWYKDGQEFFRHVPKDSEPRRKFPLPGVDVEVSDSWGSNLTLSSATLDTSGRYRCEVSGEKPLFPTVSSHGDLLVVVPPQHGPELSGLQSEYHIGDKATVNCTSGQSRPATSLSWFINGDRAPTGGITTYHPDKNGFVTTSSSFTFVIKENHFKRNSLKVKCLATLSTLYWKSNEETARKGRSKEGIESKNIERYVHISNLTNVIRIPRNKAFSLAVNNLYFIQTIATLAALTIT